MMGWMCRGLVSCWVWWSLLSMVTAEEQIQLGGPEDCRDAKFIPGHNLGGKGFDIVKMEQKRYVIDIEKWDIGNGSCRMSQNSYHKNAKQKMPAAVVLWSTVSECSMKVSSMNYESSEALVKDSTSSVSNNWKLGLELPSEDSVTVGGTHSREAQFSMMKSKEDKFSFTKHVVDCSYYRYQISSSPPLHYGFLQALQSLPQQYDPDSYQSIIDMFGTHYTTGVKLGGKMKAVTAIRTCKAGLYGLTDTAVKNCLDVEASGTHKDVTLTAEMQQCQALKKKMNTDKFSSVFSERQTEIVGGNVNGEDLLFPTDSHPNALKEWRDSLKTIPDVVTYCLKPLHLVLNKSHPARQGLKEAVKTYIRENALKKVCSESCKIGHKNKARDHCACVCEASQDILSNCCPAERGIATLKVFKLHAEGLYGDPWTQTDGSVEVTYNNQIMRTAVINDNDNPRWSESFNFGPVKLSMGSELTFRVYDADSYWNSDLLGECKINPSRGDETRVCTFIYGTFFYSYTVQCGLSLHGPNCSQYSPSPMETPLAERFSSRNGKLVKDL